MQDIDILGSYNTLKATLPHLSASAQRNPNSGANASTGGRIIFVSATLHYAGTPLQAHVSVAKAGIDALSASCAIELGPRGITSNVIAPGPIAGTEGMERLVVDGGRGKGEAEALRREPLGRYGRVKEIADATVFLFGDAGSYVNGAVLTVDGASWRKPGGMAVGGSGVGEYPGVLDAGVIEGVKGGKKLTATAKL